MYHHQSVATGRKNQVLTDTIEVGPTFVEANHVEQRDHRLVRDLLDKQLEGVTVVGNARQRAED